MASIKDFLGSDSFKNLTSLGGPLASIAGGLFQGMFQKGINEQNIQMQRETNALQQHMFNQNLAWQRESQQMQNEYNSMGAQLKRAEDAGVSASALFNSGGSTASSIPASTGSSGSGIPSLTSPRNEMIQSSVANMIGNISLVAKAMSDISQSGLSDANKESVLSKLQAELDGLKLDNDSKKLALSLETKFADKERQMRYDILVQSKSKQASEILLNEELTRTEKEKQFNLVSDALLKDAERLLKKKDLEVFNEKFDLWKKDIMSQIGLRSSEVTYNQAKTEEAKASTENIEEDTELIKLRQDMQELDNALKANEKKISDSTVHSQISAIMSKARNLRNISRLQEKEIEKLQEEIKLARKQNNTYMENLLWQRLKDIVGMSVSINGAANQSVKTGVSTGLMLGGF